MGCRFVAYYRVGDPDDLAEQVRCIADHVAEARGELIKQYRDEESLRPERPALHRALAFSKRNQATLIVATLKGLSRDVHFLRTLRDSGVDFLACDLLDANTSTVRVLTALAEYESRVASQRSRKALAAYKARGGKLGAARPEGRNLDAQARSKGARKAGTIVSALADQAYKELAPLLRRLRREGLTLKQIAERLNAEGHRTRRGRPWNAMQVSRVLKRSIAG
jgi:DNA invertase Pin-like site-specific DNA recombinase